MQQENDMVARALGPMYINLAATIAATDGADTPSDGSVITDADIAAMVADVLATWDDE